jgi:hypothetical protein
MLNEYNCSDAEKYGRCSDAQGILAKYSGRELSEITVYEGLSSTLSEK